MIVEETMCVGCNEVKILKEIATARRGRIVDCVCDCGENFMFRLYVIDDSNQTINYRIPIIGEVSLDEFDARISQKQ